MQGVGTMDKNKKRIIALLLMIAVFIIPAAFAANYTDLTALLDKVSV